MLSFLKVKKIRVAKTLVMVGLPLILGCSSYYTESVAPTQDATLNVSMSITQVGALAKASSISLSALIVSLTSSENDQIRDTLTPTTNPPLNPIATQAQTFSMSFTIKPNVTWKAVAWTLDTRDSIVHLDSITIPALESGATRSVSWNLSPKFTMYDAQFLIPDSVNFSTEENLKEVLNINRLVLQVDGITVADSTANPGPYFTPDAIAVLPFDYVTPGKHTIQLLAYGPFGTWNQANPLFSGSATVNVEPGQDSSLGIQLNWVGPAGVTDTLGVTIGRVGTVTANVTGPVNVVP
jgi:hypothetical protein